MGVDAPWYWTTYAPGYQTGPGNEGFFIRGFVQEFSEWGANQHKFDCDIELDPDVHLGKVQSIGKQCGTFEIGSPGSPSMPGAYIAMLSVMEEDSGDAMVDWEIEIAKIASDVIHPEVIETVKQEIEKYRDLIDAELEEVLEDYENEVIDIAIHAAEILVEAIVHIVASASTAVVVAAVVALAVAIITAVINDSEDDLYVLMHSSLFYTQPLTSNGLAEIHKLAGHKHPDGSYRLQPQSKVFYGIPGHNFAAAFDGSEKSAFAGISSTSTPNCGNVVKSAGLWVRPNTNRIRFHLCSPCDS